VRRSDDNATERQSAAEAAGSEDGAEGAGGRSANGAEKRENGTEGKSADMFSKFEVISETARSRRGGAKQTSITSFLKRK